VKTLLIVPDGVGLRNFICSDFAPRAVAAGGLTVWHALPEPVVAEHRDRLGPEVEWRPLPIRREPITARVLRAGKTFASLQRRPLAERAPLLRNRNPDVVGRWVHRAARCVGLAASIRPGVVAHLERPHARAALGRDAGPWADEVRRTAPDVVLCTHQRSSVAVPAIAAARRLGVPTATFIYSWDNLPKGRMAIWPDHYLVWSDHMAADLARYYPDVGEQRVHVVGTPQFEHHHEEALLEDRAAFLGRLGLDPGRKVVLFSGVDVSTSPEDPAYLADVATALAARPPDARPQLVFRRSPADLSGRYEPVLRLHPEVVVAEPQWTSPGEGWDRAVPRFADIALLVNLVRHCDVVVNFGSTMALDFALVDKPAVYLAYEPDRPTPGWSAADIYRLPHFETVHRIQPVHWVRDRRELGNRLGRALDHPDEKAAARREWAELIVAHPIDAASRRCVAALETIASTAEPAGTKRGSSFSRAAGFSA
jgi:hypothetical protein